ncbi:tetratricopeptide repeat protein [Nocardia yamanashiensis]|uniref:tetratricopeptide repeat protein n=1 Tax=Nocardia yamanashiensis TaxID=209247 RepID=UPI00082CE540|nr:tetratricopeptide repeat protein [Nocardia yamanashiensis]
MKGSYSYAEPVSTAPPLADCYSGVEPLTWNGAKVYPLHSAPIGLSPTTVSLNLRAVAPRRGVRSLGIGLAVDAGYVLLSGRQLMGVDVWSDAMTGGIDLQVCPTADAVITLTPVWVDDTGAVLSWSGNYGMLVTRESACTVLHCSTGVGPPDFGELVVELTTATTPPPPEPPAELGRYQGALYDLGVAMHGRGEVQQACELWRQAASFGHTGAAYDLGVVRFRQGEFAEAERYWRSAAHDGDVRAMAGLAAVLERRGNISEARVWRAAVAAEQ